MLCTFCMAKRLYIVTSKRGSATLLNVCLSFCRSNILLTEDKIAKVADFGLSAVRELDGLVSCVSISMPVGTRCYMPPEAFKGVLSKSLDVYAYGMVSFNVKILTE